MRMDGNAHSHNYASISIIRGIRAFSHHVSSIYCITPTSNYSETVYFDINFAVILHILYFH